MTLESPPKFSIGKLMSLRDKLRTEVVWGLLGETLDDETLNKYITRVINCMKLDLETKESVVDDSDSFLVTSTLIPQTIKNTLMPYIGRELDTKLSEKLAILLAGNKNNLTNGIPVLQWSGTTEPIWAPFEIYEAFPLPRRSKAGVVLYQMEFLCLEGVATSEIIRQVIPATFVHRLAVSLGLSRYNHYEIFDLIRMWLNAVITPDNELSEFDTQPHQQDHNRKLYKGRKEKQESCKAKSCKYCQFGYNNTCRYSTHPHDREIRECYNGHKGWFDVVDKIRICLACRSKRTHRKEK